MEHKTQPIRNLISQLYDESSTSVPLPRAVTLFVGEVEDVLDKAEAQESFSTDSIFQAEGAYKKALQEQNEAIEKVAEDYKKYFTDLSVLIKATLQDFYALPRPEQEKEENKLKLADNLFNLSLLAHEIESVEHSEYTKKLKHFEFVNKQAQNLIEYIEKIAAQNSGIKFSEIKTHLETLENSAQKETQFLDRVKQDYREAYSMEVEDVLKQISVKTKELA